MHIGLHKKNAMTAEIIYEGGLRTRNIHLQSGNAIHTDAPIDNHGKGQAFSPTDLLATAAVSCILTVAAIKAEAAGISLEGSRGQVKKIMQSDPRRISELQISIEFPAAVEQEKRPWIEEICLNCPVMLSLHPDIRKAVEFSYSA